MSKNKAKDTVIRLQREKDKLDAKSKEVSRQLAEAKVAERDEKKKADNGDIKYKSKLKIANGMLAIFYRANGETYKFIGEELGVSAARASHLVHGQLNRLRWDSERLDTQSYNWNKLSRLSRVQSDMAKFLEEQREKKEHELTADKSDETCTLFIDGKELMKVIVNKENTPALVQDVLMDDMRNSIGRLLMVASNQEMKKINIAQQNLNESKEIMQ